MASGVGCTDAAFRGQGQDHARVSVSIAPGTTLTEAAPGAARIQLGQAPAGIVPGAALHPAECGLREHCSVGLPIGVAVFAPAAMQACGGRVHVTDRTVGGRVFAAVADSSVEIDLTGVRACHLVRSTAAHGPTSALELDDEDGRCVAVITQFGMVGEDVHAAWEHLAASLPDA